MKGKSKIWKQARETVKNPQKLSKLIDDVKAKADTISDKGAYINELKEKLSALVRMVRFYISGTYRAFSTKSMLLIVFALVYFVLPIDTIPDFIPALGFTDDISIIYYILKTIEKDINKFREWESSVTQ